MHQNFKTNYENDIIFIAQIYHPFCYIQMKDEIEHLIILHYSSAKDVFKSFQRLFRENEPPALIIADLLKEKNESGDSAE